MTVENQTGNYSMVPDLDTGYVSFGHHHDVKRIVESGRFYPAYITGMSGNGKTLMVKQVCAESGRECVRVNVTIETDEDDLIGGFRLVDGNTVWQDGPVVVAMERGAILLLDEVDLGSTKLMCMQPILEGGSLFIKKIGKVVRPKDGFNIIATANTKGKGSEDGRFIGTNFMNEAFLERFSVTFEQEYPSPEYERMILGSVLSSASINDSSFLNAIVSWAGITRKTFMDGGSSELISTRRLVHICNAYAIFGDKEKAIRTCISRFDEETKQSFIGLYNKLYSNIEEAEKAARAKKNEQRVSETATTIKSGSSSMTLEDLVGVMKSRINTIPGTTTP